jgi:uncharacterized membrane protein YiaA
MGSQIAGWTLFGLGVIIYLIAIWERVRSRTTPSKEGLESLREIKETAEAITKLAEAFSKFSEEIQFLLLGTGLLIAGIYLLSNQPF